MPPVNISRKQQNLYHLYILIGSLLFIILYQQSLLNSGRLETAQGLVVCNQPRNIPEGYSDDDNVEEEVDAAIASDDYIQTSGEDREVIQSISVNNPVSSSSSSKSTITIVTGTHFGSALLKIDETTQHATCLKLANELHLLWVAWGENLYSRAKIRVHEALKEISQAGVSCVLSGSRKYSMLWTFPMSWRPEIQCDSKMKTVLATKSYLREKTKIYVNWFLLRPDLVTFANMASVENVKVKFAISIGNDPTTAAFTFEGCQRFNTILNGHDVYKQRLLLVALSDIEHQLERIKSIDRKVIACTKLESNEVYAEFSNWITSSKILKFSEVCGPLSKIVPQQVDKTHLGTMLKMSLFHGVQSTPIPKTVFNGPRLVFIAGLEGVGHHVFSLLGKKHTTRDLYDALTDHLCDSAWDDDSLNKYPIARQNLVNAIRQLKTESKYLPRDGSNVIFLNTVWALKDVNMYSYPWGGPKCYLKRYARVMCNIDLVELCRIAEEAGIDFRVILLKRSIGAAVVSASLHRPFGTLVSETRMLALSQALLMSGITNIDRKFTLEINYEDMINHPMDATAKLADHLGFDKSSTLYTHFEQTLLESSIEHPVGDGSRWKEEVDLVQLQFMSDLLGL